MPDTTQTTKKQKRSLLQIVLTTGLLASLSTSLISYINSSFLETFLPKNWVGIVFSVAYAVTFLVIQNYALIIRKFKNHNVALIVFALEIVALLTLAANVHWFISLLAFILLVVCYNVIVINYDIFIEQLSTHQNEGRIRGLFWTASNLGFLLGPLMTGVLSAKYGFSAAYLIAGLLLIPVWLMIAFSYKKAKAVKYKKHMHLYKTVARVHRNPNLRGIFLIAMMLYLFYSWMVIYTPIHLLEIGFTWEQIGVIFTVMLVPFVLIEYPAGWLADKYLGETEMLTLGFGIMGSAVTLLLFTSSFWGVMLVLFLSRIGASLVEIMRDVYFYKKVDEDDLDLIDLFRNMRSVAYVFGPILASVLLAFNFGMYGVFIVLSLLMFAAMFVPITIKDTK
jgi:MFS family permease